MLNKSRETSSRIEEEINQNVNGIIGFVVVFFYGKTEMNVNPNANLCIPFMSAHIASFVSYCV